MKFRIDKVRGGWETLYKIASDGTETRIGKYRTMRAAEVAMMIRITNP